METASLDYLQYYVLLGSLLGKAIYEKILVEPLFAGMFLNHLLGRINLIDDLPSLDNQVKVLFFFFTYLDLSQFTSIEKELFVWGW